MRFSLVCWFKDSVPGHIFRGKTRLVKRVSKNAMETKVREYQRQDKVMHLLRYPYLTSEESHGHAKHLMKSAKVIAAWNDYKLNKSMKPHVTVEERLNHLKCGEGWE